MHREDVSDGVLAEGFGLPHRYWLARPLAAATWAALWYAFIAASAFALGIGWNFLGPDSTEVDGFMRTRNWGWLFLLALPAVTLLLGVFFGMLDEALVKLDGIVKPADELDQKASPPFSMTVRERFRDAWGLWIHPVAFSLAVVLTIAADGRDIIAPLESATIRPSDDVDFFTVGYKVEIGTPLTYLAFNAGAFSMQVFLAYCGFTLILMPLYLFALVGRYALKGRTVRSVLGSAERRYRVEWDYSDPSGRCGLKALDQVYVAYQLLTFLSIGLGLLSIWSNLGSKTGFDKGSYIIVACNLLLLPAAFFWVIIPYWTEFPRELPSKYEGRDYTKPVPWPLGSPMLGWALIGATGSVWSVMGAMFLYYLFGIGEAPR